MPSTATESASALRLEFPAHLPISARRAEIEAAVRANQVVIICGETGSGKTTQLPKMLLAMGRGQGGRMIGHTQPRRIAATSVARRIAQEMSVPLGEVVGYRIRFQDRSSDATRVQLMTDGILLAQTQSDPLLRGYDTLIIDEAHERSLNIDFLLGYLKQLLPRRPELKLIITSATIDADRFARHFGSEGHPAPVLQVSGRTFPVEQRWRPWEETRDHGQKEAIADAVDELWGQAAPAGDILVFLPGEREIREAATHLQRQFQAQPLRRSVQVLPLFARLSQAEQARIFEPHAQARVVLATNVAETSLTVPGIRYVVDVGTARVKRYSLRSKVERLLVEPVSQAAADQRAGRCGRTAGGICIRLYDEQDYRGRPRFTDPEILRSSLAGVILRMKSLGLLAGTRTVEDFPFLDPPSRSAIADGYQLLAELGAVTEEGVLTPVGQELARLPLDPRVARMLLAARDGGALREALVIASALSTPDVRDRPLQLQPQADQRHTRFDDAKSEFMGYLKLWQWLHDVREGLETDPEPDAGAPGAGRIPANAAVLPAHKRQAPAPPGHAARKKQRTGRRLSNRQWEARLRQQFISVRRVREWRNVHQQLRAAVLARRWKENSQPASYDALHKALLAGLLGNIGCRRDPEKDRVHKGAEYLGARGIRFTPHPGVHLSRKPGRWIMCAELVQTTRLYARGVASFNPRWLEDVAAHLIQKQVLHPHWEQKAAAAMALERGLLYGLVVYQGRRVPYGRIAPREAREIMLRSALVEGDWPEHWNRTLPFLRANQKLIAQVQGLEHKARRQDLLVDDELIYAFYEQHIPDGVTDGRGLEKWYRQASREQPRLLYLTREQLMRHEAAGVTTDAFPRLIRLGGIDCKASYLHAPGDERDGLTVTIPLFALNRVQDERVQWLVPGMLPEKVEALLRCLPQRARSRLGPLRQNAARFAEQLLVPERFARGSLLEELAGLARAHSGLELGERDFQLTALPPHLHMNFLIVDEHGRRLGMSRVLQALKAELGRQALGAFQALAQLKTVASVTDAGRAAGTDDHTAGAGASKAPAPSARAEAVHDAEQRHTDWDFGELPEMMEIRRGRQVFFGFPALVDHGDCVMLEVFDEQALATAAQRKGLRRLFALQVADSLNYQRKHIPDLTQMAVHYMPLGTADELQEQILDLALERAFMVPPLPTSADEFQTRAEQGRKRLGLLVGEVARQAATILEGHAQARRKIRECKFQAVAQDEARHLERLMRKHFLRDTPWDALRHYPRYLQAIVARLEKLPASRERDAQAMGALQGQQQRLQRAMEQDRHSGDPRLQELRWMLEELRVSLFAQELRTPYPVSVKRLEKAWGRLH